MSGFNRSLLSLVLKATASLKLITLALFSGFSLLSIVKFDSSDLVSCSAIISLSDCIT